MCYKTVHVLFPVFNVSTPLLCDVCTCMYNVKPGSQYDALACVVSRCLHASNCEQDTFATL